MQVIVNNEPREIQGRTLADLLEELGFGGTVVATAVNVAFEVMICWMAGRSVPGCCSTRRTWTKNPASGIRNVTASIRSAGSMKIAVGSERGRFMFYRISNRDCAARQRNVTAAPAANMASRPLLGRSAMTSRSSATRTM